VYDHNKGQIGTYYNPNYQSNKKHLALLVAVYAHIIAVWAIPVNPTKNPALGRVFVVCLQLSVANLSWQIRS
jgi:hypothetical protein